MFPFFLVQSQHADRKVCFRPPTSVYTLAGSRYRYALSSTPTAATKPADPNLCGAYARPTNERFLVRGTGGYNQGSSVYFAKGCGGWVFAGVNGVG